MDTDPPVPVGDLLRRYRVASGQTQEELAEASGVSARSISDLERGLLRRSRKDTIHLLADALALAPEERDRFEAAARVGHAAPANIRTAHNLPAALTPLLGREHDVAGARAILRRADVRLLTLTGPGGIGKTRLAIKIAADARGDFTDGVFFVSLAPVQDPRLVPSVIAQTLGLREARNHPARDRLLDDLRDRHLLLLLDNFEHLTAAISLVTDILIAAPKVKVLATSRAALLLSGEHEWPVPPLALPDLAHLPNVTTLAQFPAIALFLQRARAIHPTFRLTEANAPAVAAICTRLDGLPLAIELATAQTRFLSPQAILARIEQRLDLPAPHPRDLPARHQTLQTAIAWSYDLLDASAQTVFRRLAVFAGGWSLEAAATVCDMRETDVTAAIATLVHQSLVQATEGPDAMPRFGMLETVRAFTADLLTASGEETAIRDAHARTFLNRAEDAEPMLRGPEQEAWLDILAVERDNFHAALAWVWERQDAEIVVRLAAALSRFWWHGGNFAEATFWLERALALSTDTSTAAQAKALFSAGRLAWTTGDRTAAHTYCEQSLALCRASGDMRGVGFALNILGRVALDEGEYPRAATLLEEAITQFRACDDEWSLATVLTPLGNAIWETGDMPRARAIFAESLELNRRLGARQNVAFCLNFLGRIAAGDGDLAQAVALHHESLAYFQELGDRRGIAFTLSHLGRVARDQGDTHRAAADYRESLERFSALNLRPEIAWCLEGLASVRFAAGEAEDAVRLASAAEALRERVDAPRPAHWDTDLRQWLSVARACLGEEQATICWAEGRARRLETVIAAALSDTYEAQGSDL